MFPSQINELAKHYANTLNERPRTVMPTTPRRRSEAGPIRRHTGWTLVQIGLRIAASGTR
jgi:hypothetical protein